MQEKLIAELEAFTKRHPEFLWDEFDKILAKAKSSVGKEGFCKFEQEVKAGINALYVHTDWVALPVKEYNRLQELKPPTSQDGLRKELEEPGHTVYPPMRGTVQEESLEKNNEILIIVRARCGQY